MRCVSLTPLVWLAACGSEPRLLASTHLATAASLDNGSAADAIVGQLSERGRSQSRTDAGSFLHVTGLAVGLGNNQLWVVDNGNQRVLGYSTMPTADGTEAEMVLNQQDFYTTDFRNVPEAHRITPVGVATDPEERVYVYNASRVLVFENPFSDDAVADYELHGLPTNLLSVRALDNNKLAVVGSNNLEIYERGSADPYAQAGFTEPCPETAYDTAQEGDILFVACDETIVVYQVDAVTGFVEREGGGLPEAFTAYTGLLGARSIDIDSNYLLVAETTRHRLLRFPNPVSQANAVISETGTAQTPAAADAIYGQASATSEPVTNYHSSGIPQVSSQGLFSPTFLAIAPGDHRMWVADSVNYRVNVYSNISAADPNRYAQNVLGQPDSTHAWANRLEANSFVSVGGVALGIGTGGAVRAAVVDPGAHRVLLFEEFADYVTGEDPDHVLGQVNFADYEPNRGTGIAAAGLNYPTHAAIGPNGWVWVTDAGNRRVLAYESPVTGAYASRVFGAGDSTSSGIYDSFGAIAVSDDYLFVAAGNRVFIYAADSAVVEKPYRVIGQDQPPSGTPDEDDIGNTANRGAGPAADSLWNVNGLAVDSDGRLWVADGGNHRVLWFDDPTSTNLTESVTADGVLGQPDFSSNTEQMGLGATNRYGFAGVYGIALSEDGTLWVSDIAENRVLAFFTPTEVDPVMGAPRADRVLGQEDFTSSAANNALNGINASTLSMPFDVAATGRLLLISDLGNHRALRTIRNRPPVAAGSGEHEVVRGEQLDVMVTVTDPENDAIDIAANAPYVSAMSGSSPLSVPVSFEAPADAAAGSRTVVNVVATDTGPRPQTTTFSVVFRVIDRVANPAGGAQPSAREAIDPDTGCVCSTGATALPWLVAVVGWRRRRERI